VKSFHPHDSTKAKHGGKSATIESRTQGNTGEYLGGDFLISGVHDISGPTCGGGDEE
jgi:hypothetical protein